MNSLYENDIFKEGKINSYVEGIASFYGCTANFTDSAVDIEGETIASVNMALAAIEEFITSESPVIYTTPSGRTIKPRHTDRSFMLIRSTGPNLLSARVLRVPVRHSLELRWPLRLSEHMKYQGSS